MELMIIIAIALGVAALVAIAGAWFIQRQRHTSDLRGQFGDEYEYEVARRGSRSDAEKELDARRDRVNSLNIRMLTADEYGLFSRRWTDAQAGFVDDPARAIVEADLLCREVMEARGYPMGDFEQRAADISVDHPHVVENYRSARAIAVANAEDKATTEELRRAMKHYRELFDDLLETDDAPETERHDRTRVRA